MRHFPLIAALAVGARLIVAAEAVSQPGDSLMIPAHVINNSTGDPVTDLTASDFVVSIDRRDRPVSAVELVRPSTQTFVVVIDQSSFWTSATPAAREAVTRVLDRAGPGDKIGLIAYPGSIAIPPTTDRTAIRAALKNINGAWAADTPLDERSARSLDGLESAIRAQASGGHKTFVFVTAGAPVAGGGTSQADLDKIAVRFARASPASDVTLYTLFMNTPFLSKFGTARPPIALADAMDTLGRSVYFAARGTGGTFYQLEVGTDRFVGNLIKDAGAYYRLTFAPFPSEGDGKDHMISISVNRPGVLARAPAAITISKPSR